jgi:hypothetical protein
MSRIYSSAGLAQSELRWLALAVVGIGNVILATPAMATDFEPCQVPLKILPIPQPYFAHVDFPVDLRALSNHSPGLCGMQHWFVVSGPKALEIDQAGGLFYWTPAQAETAIITLAITETPATGIPVIATLTFQITVDNNTITYPLWRDYLSQPTEVTIEGRALGAGEEKQFVSYRLDYALMFNEFVLPTTWTPITGDVVLPVEVTGPLADWDVSKLKDGSRIMLRLKVELSDGTQSEVLNQVILDRTIKKGWTRRIGPITHSIVPADLNDDGKDEMVAVTHFGELYIFGIDGTKIYQSGNYGAAYSGPSVGDVDGDGYPEIVWATDKLVLAHRANGSLLQGFPILVAAGYQARTTPTLADLDGDEVLDIIFGARAGVGGKGRVHAYRYDAVSEKPVVLPGWPTELGTFDVYASASVADLDKDGSLDVVVESHDRVHAWNSNGISFPGFDGGVLLEAPSITLSTNGTGAATSSAQPALGDINGDGIYEIVVGTNVLTPDGLTLPGWEGAQLAAPNAQFAMNGLSAALADLDHQPDGNLEVVVGNAAFAANGASLDLSLSGNPPLAPAIVGDCGGNHADIMAGSRSDQALGVFSFEVETGSLTGGYPKSLYGNTGDVGAPAIGDFDGDGLVDVAVAITDASYGGILAVYNMPGPNHDEKHQWPMLGHDARHTGRYTLPKPNQPTALSAKTSATAIKLQWVDNSSVEDGYLVERSASGAPFSYIPVAVLPVNATSHADKEPAKGASPYAYYRIRAYRNDPLAGEILSRPSSPRRAKAP